jgi:hypothetical protein
VASSREELQQNTISQNWKNAVFLSVIFGWPTNASISKISKNPEIHEMI